MPSIKAKKIKMRVRRGDNVVVISGRDKGKTGEVLRVDRERNRVLVQGVNMMKRHQRPSQRLWAVACPEGHETFSTYSVVVLITGL